MNHHRNGKAQHKITTGLNYWPNRESAGAPVLPSNGGYKE